MYRLLFVLKFLFIFLFLSSYSFAETIKYTSYNPSNFEEIFSGKYKSKSVELSGKLTLPNGEGEYPVVIFPLLKQHFMMLQRNLVYTGLTRAKKKVIFVGDPTAYAMAIRNDKTLVRQTDLIRKLTKSE